MTRLGTVATLCFEPSENVNLKQKKVGISALTNQWYSYKAVDLL